VLLEEIRAAGIDVREKTLLPEDLESADEVFIASTTRELLPVVSIEGLKVRRSGAVRLTLQQAFTSYVSAYVAPRRRPVAAI
jgi:branched-chain amino acid aminotransferase